MSQLNSVNYGQTSRFQDYVCAVARGNTLLTVFKCDEPHKRIDGKRVSFEVNALDLSIDAENPNDEAWACVQGSELMYWSKSELESIGIYPSRKNPVPDVDYIFDNTIILK